MAAQGIEGIVVDIVRQWCRVHIAAMPKVRILLLHERNESTEEGHLCAIISEGTEKPGVGVQGPHRNVFQHIGSKGFLDKVIAADSGTVFQYSMQDMGKCPLISFIFWKNAS